MRLFLFKECSVRLPRAKLRRLCEHIVAGERFGRSRSEIHLVFVPESKMRRLNRRYRGIDRTTDVLSFNLDPAKDPDGVFGEVYISPTVAARQALRHAVPVTCEISRLFCHGLLHLLGYDHAGEAEGSVMKTREDHYLKRLCRK